MATGEHLAIWRQDLSPLGSVLSLAYDSTAWSCVSAATNTVLGRGTKETGFDSYGPASPEDTSHICIIASIFQRPPTPSQELTEMKKSAPSLLSGTLYNCLLGLSLVASPVCIHTQRMRESRSSKADTPTLCIGVSNSKSCYFWLPAL